MTELEELKLAYAECSRQRNELLNILMSQAQRTWVELTDEEFDEATAYANPHCDEWAFAKAIEAILREKNS